MNREERQNQRVFIPTFLKASAVQGKIFFFFLLTCVFGCMHMRVFEFGETNFMFIEALFTGQKDSN